MSRPVPDQVRVAFRTSLVGLMKVLKTCLCFFLLFLFLVSLSHFGFCLPTGQIS